MKNDGTQDCLRVCDSANLCVRYLYVQSRVTRGEVQHANSALARIRQSDVRGAGDDGQPIARGVHWIRVAVGSHVEIRGGDGKQQAREGSA